MVFAVSQESFNEAVQENINEFGMTPEEALKDAVEQFAAQVNIIFNYHNNTYYNIKYLTMRAKELQIGVNKE